jgi:hypothetical protein
MKRRVAEGYVKSIVGIDHAAKDILGVVLPPQGDVQRVEFTNLPCRFDRPRIDIGAREMPAVFALARQGLNKTRTSADVQSFDLTPSRDALMIVVGKQVRKIVDIVYATGNGWAEIPRGDIPKINVVVRL